MSEIEVVGSESITGVSNDPKARASAARQGRQATSADLHDTDPASSVPPEPKPLVRSVRVGLIKPLGEDTWDAVGARLRDMHGTMHRLLNAGVRASAIDGGGQKTTAAAARAAVKAALVGEREYWAGKVGKRHEGSNHDPAKAERMAEFALPSVVEDTLAIRSSKAYLDARKHMFRGDKSLPSYNRHAPIFFRDGNGAWQLRRTESGQYEIGFKLHPNRGPKVWFAVQVNGASAYADLKRMISGAEGVKLGDAKIIRNDKLRMGPQGKRMCIWEARLCYTSPAPTRVIGDGVVAVHRGMHQMLTLASTNGQSWPIPGDAYRAAKIGLAARRKSLQMHIRKGELGHGARGRGVRRRYQALDRLGDAEARMIKSACQQAAARVLQFALRDGAGVIVIEDYQTIVPHIDDESARFMVKWPWAQFKGCVDWAARKAGLRVVEVPAQYISQKCPACGTTSKENVGWWRKLTEEQRAEEALLAEDTGVRPNDGPPRGPEAGRTHAIAMFECVECGLKRNTDVIAAFNMLAAYGLGDEPRQKFEAALKRLARQQKLRDEIAAE